MNSPRISPEKRIAAMRRKDRERRAAISEQTTRVEDALHGSIDHPSITPVSMELSKLREMINSWPILL